MELRLQIEDSYLRNLLNRLRLPSAFETITEALRVLNWVVNERARGRTILSAQPHPDGSFTDLRELETPAMKNIKIEAA